MAGFLPSRQLMPERIFLEMKRFYRKEFFLKLVFLLFAFVLFWRTLIDTDFGIHLRIGEYIWNQKRIPRTDILSFSLPDYPYVYHSWLSEVFVFWAYSLFELWGVTFFYCFLGVLITWLILETVRLRIKEKWIYSFLLFLVPLVAQANNLRVQLFSTLGLAFVYYALRSFLAKNKRLVYLVPLVFALWANLHGGFILGLIFFFSFLIIEALSFILSEVIPFEIFGKDVDFLPLKDYFLLSLVLLVSCLAALLNPYGVRIYEQVFLMGTNRFAAANNMDWYPFIKPSGSSWLIAFLIFVIYSLFLIFKSKIELREKLLFGLFFVLTLKMNRFSLALFTMLIPTLVFFVSWIKNSGKEIFKRMRPFLIYMYIVLVLTLVTNSVLFFDSMRRAYQDEEVYAQKMPEPYTYPIGAVNYIRNHQVSERLFNDFNWGGYLLWKFPERKFFIDGRMDNFFVDDQSFARFHQEILYLKSGWQEKLEKYEIEAILISVEWPLAEALKISPDWELIYEDDVSVLFINKTITD